MWFTLARSNTYSPSPARLAPGVRATCCDIVVSSAFVRFHTIASPTLLSRQAAHKGGAGRFRSERVAASTTCGRSSRDAQRDDAGAAITLSQRPQSHTRGTPGQCDLKLCSGRIFAVPARRDSGRRTVPLGTLDSAQAGAQAVIRSSRSAVGFVRPKSAVGFARPKRAGNGRTPQRQAPACRAAACLSARSHHHQHTLLRPRMGPKVEDSRTRSTKIFTS